MGEEKNVNLQQPIPIDLSDMVTTYKKGYDKYLSLYRSILSDDILHVFEEVKNLENAFNSFPMETWAKTVYSFIATFHKTDTESRATLIDALRILWIGRLASFIKETANVDPENTEARIKEQAIVFEKMKPYLTELF